MGRTLFPATQLKRFGADRNAVSAVEFALLLPIILLLLLGSFDVTRAIQAKNKSILLARTLADFVAQNQTITTAQLAGIVKASKFVLSPFKEVDSKGNSVLTINIESVNRLPNGTYEIDWSYPPAHARNVSTNIPIADVSAIRARVTYTYKLRFAGSLMTNFGVSEIVLNSTTNMSPRWVTPVTAAGTWPN